MKKNTEKKKLLQKENPLLSPKVNLLKEHVEFIETHTSTLETLRVSIKIEKEQNMDFLKSCEKNQQEITDLRGDFAAIARIYRCDRIILPPCVIKLNPKTLSIIRTDHLLPFLVDLKTWFDTESEITFIKMRDFIESRNFISERHTICKKSVENCRVGQYPSQPDSLDTILNVKKK